MAATQHALLFDETDAMLFGDADLFGSGVTCIAGELELQVQSYEGTGDLHGGNSSAGKSFSLTKDSGGSSLSAMVVGDFADTDLLENVSLADLAAADHYGHTICGRQSTADSAAIAAASTGRHPVSWNATGGQSACAANAPAAGLQFDGSHEAQHQQQQQGQESSDCDMSHTVGDGESSGVGPGKGVALGCSHSEASEDNTAGVAACREEEHVSMPSYGLSLSRLTHGTAQRPKANASCVQQPSQPLQQPQQQEQQPAGALPRAFSVDSFAHTSNASTALPEAPASQTEVQRRTQVLRSYSYVAPDTLPMDFSLGCGDNGVPLSFGARGRCASLNETQLRRHWLQEGDFLAPRLPPSVSELELLELPEDSVPVRTHRCTLIDMQQSAANGGAGLGPGSVATHSLASGLTQFKGASSASATPTQAAAAAAASVNVKRKIITSPSPLLQQPRTAKSRQAAAPSASSGGGAKVQIQSPKRARVGTWQDGAVASAGGVPMADWPTAARGGAGPAAAGMKTVRSMPANMNNFFDSVEVTVEPLGVSGGVENMISSNRSVVSASTLHQPFARGPFFDASSAAVSAARPAGIPPVAPDGPQVAMPPAAKTAKARAAGGQPLQPPTIVPGMGVAGMPCGFPPAGLVGPDGKRLGPVPSVPKPRKRASPNGNPPKAPAPNPNGHCCTHCGTQTTPVWRAGPHGPKTLCNACGVRYMKVAKGNVAPTPRRQQH